MPGRMIWLKLLFGQHGDERLQRRLIKELDILDLLLDAPVLPVVFFD